MSSQPQEQKGAQLPGSLGREIAENEARGEQSFEGVNRPGAATSRAEGAAEGKGEPFTKAYSGTEEAPTPTLNMDPVRQNVAYVYPPGEAPGGADASVQRTQPESGMEGQGEAAVVAGPAPGVPEMEDVLRAAP